MVSLKMNHVYMNFDYLMRLKETPRKIRYITLKIHEGTHKYLREKAKNDIFGTPEGIKYADE